MPSAEDILSNPVSSVFFLNHRFYYGIGNTRSVDLTEGCEVPSDAHFLLLGCGDIRNVLQTVHEVTDIKPLPKSLNFHLNDIDDVVLARNAVLLRVVDTIDPSDATDIAFLWNVWYNINLSEQDCQRLKTTILDILERPFESIEFRSELLEAVKRILKYWLAKTISLENIRLQREKFVCIKAQEDLNIKEEISISDAVSHFFWMSGFQISHDEQQKQGRRQDEVQRYFRTGSTDGAVRGFTNPTLLCPHIDGWRLHPSSFPFNVFNELMFDKTSSLTENCIRQLQSQLKSWKKFKEKGSVIKITMWGGDACSLCHRRLPSTMKFDVINTSNLSDHITLLNVLLAGTKRLNRSGVLTVQTMHLIDRGYDTVADYLEKEVGIPSEFYPTFLGLKLAEDFNLGTSKYPKLFRGCAEVTIRWLSAGECTPCLRLEDSVNITQIFERLINRCFETCMLLPAKRFDNPPLTAVYLIKELSSKLDNGVTPLLEIAERCLPKKYTAFGEQFSPLELEWNVLTMYHFSKELKKDAALLSISAHLKVDWTAIDSVLPAGFEVPHRAVIIKGGINILGVMQGVSLVPWRILSVVDYDYETCTMTCILPKSEVEGYGPDTELWPIGFEGELSPLRAKESYTLSGWGITSLPIRTSSPIAQTDDTCKDGDSQISLNVRETAQSYRITLTTKDPLWTVKSFEVHIDRNDMRTIQLNCTTLASGCQDMRSSTRRFSLPCEVEPPQPNLHKYTNTIEMKKSQAYFKGPIILPFRRMSVSTKQIFPKTEKEDLFRITGTMFSTIADIKRKKVGSYCNDALFNLKETVQICINWSIYPPEKLPLIKSYMVLRGGPRRSKSCKIGYFPQDIFLGVRKLHNVHGLPTLDVVWVDFEIYRKQVPFQQKYESPELDTIFLENGMSDHAYHVLHVSLEEANLLKKALQVNTRRSVQTVKAGTPTWCFNSFLQPVYTIDAERDFVELLRGSDSAERDWKMLADISENPQQGQSSVQNELEACGFCGEERTDLKKCSRCKAVSYCCASCQKSDWKANHKKICQKIHPSEDDKKVSNLTKPKSENCQRQKCGLCGLTAAEMKRCSRCRNEFYCSKQCQQKDWDKHKIICVAHDP